MRLHTRSRARGPSILLSLSLALALLLLATLTIAQTSYYKLLDIDPSSDARTIKKAYRRLAHKLHPDKFPEKEAEFVKMSEAYQVLSDDELRKVYDRYGEEGVKRHRAGQAGGGGGGGHDPFDIFRNFFGGGAGGGGGVRKGQSKQFNIMVSLKDLYVGKTIHLEYDRSVVCHKCDGSGARSKGDVHSCEACQGRGVRIVRQEIMPGFHTQMQAVCSVCGGTGSRIAHACSLCGGAKLINEKAEIEVDLPAGTEEGEVFTYEGESDESVDLDIEAGDVIVKVTSDPSTSLFRRRGTNLYVSRTLSLPDALLGFKDIFPHMDGHNVTVDRRKGVTQPGMVVVLKGEGMPVRGGVEGQRGSLYIEYEVVLPDKVEGDLRKVLNRVWGRKDDHQGDKAEGGHDEL
ncbi:hypothetical protein BDZ90DRAFT_248804 [Jaminaea rosea]|uniref:DnaJ-domain-containing protein n=1 Tax=Jaminaea rosea TaxID=1569628 RepID=A0A316V6R4_9BASI|nr:hypothetical protein BDZ90DRAFT_248804 [Jaminaea rosea]PWN31145.1 hypothetical protein BDZ90DRAFT_248804 [Jaminaea rosea]